MPAPAGVRPVLYKLALAGWGFWTLVTIGILAALAPIHLVTVVEDEQVMRSYLAVWPNLTLREFGNLVVVLRYAGLFVFLMVAALIVWRRPNHPLTLITAMMLVTLPLIGQLGGSTDTWLLYPKAVRPLLSLAHTAVVVFVGVPAGLAFIYFFPTGRLAPRWLGWAGAVLTALFYLFALLVWLFPDVDPSGQVWFVYLGIMLVLLALGVGGQVYRYVRVSSPVERRQTGLVVTALCAFALTLFTQGLGIFGGAPRAALVGLALQWLGLVALPASMGVAILRYGLWEIDVIVRRTLIYSVLTGVLALAYFSSVVLLQSVVRALTGQSQSALVTVASTLLIATLFGPLRRRVQSAVDRRFYRRKYDATQIVAAFGEALRHEHALDQVAAKLEYVAAATVQPSQVQVWLPRQPLRPGPRPE
ncbi:MAG: hypothetical protein IT317_17245 [Anaerolineales bacterium]|nr:hypothetical protein [Anaerolineales bacterium]